ncbi:MAG TPA: hypothetical protein VHY20_11515, partial [Pirellulales bacterium]|nr:hypothetical protein [Pirellulales bacterium]
FVHAFLPAEQAAQFGRRWEQATSTIARPKLLAVLDASSDQLWHRLLDRGHVTELGLDVPQIESLRLAFAAQWSRPGGPLLRLTEMTADEALAELRAAVAAMDVECTPESE